MSPSLETIKLAEKLLMQASGASVKLGTSVELGGSKRSIVYRFGVLDGPNNLPSSVIVKHVPSLPDALFDPDSPAIPAWTFFNEWASLQFLNRFSEHIGLAPRFYAGDRANGLMVMEDLGTGRQLDHVLLATDPAIAETTLIDFAMVHGRLHALTIGLQDEYIHLREELGPIKEETDHYSYRWLTPALHQSADLLGIVPSHDVDLELAALRDMLLNPGPFLALIQRDSCPDNCIYSRARLHLLDFEGGMFRHALLGGVYGRMHFPTCWCVYRLPERILSRMEVAYRTELIKGCPEAADDKQFYRALVGACITWALHFHVMMRPLEKMLEQDRRLATLTDRQRYLLYLNVAASASEQFGYLPAIGKTLRAIADRLAQLWPEATDPSFYPAFRNAQF